MVFVSFLLVLLQVLFDLLQSMLTQYDGFYLVSITSFFVVKLIFLMFIVYLRVGIKLRFLFKSWNVAFVNVFLLRFMTCPIGSDWYLVVFSTVLQSFLMFSWFVLCCLSCLLFLYFALGLRCCYVFECVHCCFGSFNNGL